MYSVVLMTAMVSGPDVGFDPLFSNGGCSVCFGYSGSGTCMGCIGFYPRCGNCGLFPHAPGCFFPTYSYSCCGCSGVTCYGCGCGGWVPASSCAIAPCEWGPRSGQFGWVGASCLGSFQYGCHGGCTGLVTYSYWGPPTGMPLYNLYGLPWSATTREAPPMIPPAVAPPEIKPGDLNGPPQASANVKFTLPEGAVLYVNGVATKQTGAERSFVTPPLARGDRYGYDVRAELLVNGRLEVEERQVVVVAGGQVTESFPKLLALAGRSGDRVTGK